MIRWTDSAMFSHDPHSGVYNGMTPQLNIHKTNSGVLCPARLSNTNSIRNDGSSAGKVIGHCKSCCQLFHNSRLADLSSTGWGGILAKIASNSSLSQACKTTFGLLVTPRPLTSPLWG